MQISVLTPIPMEKLKAIQGVTQRQVQWELN